MRCSVPHRLLIVDDDQHLRAIGHEMLADDGYIIEEATNGAEALEAIDRGGVCLVLLDLTMPVMDGWDVLSVRVGESAPPVIVINSVVVDSYRRRAMELGAVGFLQKPFAKAELSGAIRSALGEE